MRTSIARLLMCQLVLACTLVACDDAGVQEEQIAKGIEGIPAAEHAEQPSDGQHAQPETPESSDSRFPWVVPEGWVFDETPRQMRVATYMAPTETSNQEVAVTRFPGRVGGELANINRWRGQMGLAPISEGELEEHIDRFTMDGYDGYQIRIESDSGAMLASAVFDESINQTWFVRATLSTRELADQLESDVFAMARSIAQ